MSSPVELRAERLMCMPLPGSLRRGFGEKSAARPLRRATTIHDTIAERDRIVRGFDRLGIPEIDLILTGALFMVGHSGRMPHLFKRQADLAADVLAISSGAMSMYPAAVVGDRGRFAVFVPAEE